MRTLEQYIKPENRDDKVPEQVYYSPSKNFILRVFSYKTKVGAWNYTMGAVSDFQNGELLFEIHRNYSSFWHLFVQHPNGNEYLLCGEDYQGYTCINLTEKKRYDYLPKEAKEGFGWCWISAEFLEKELQVKAEGCIWAGPYEFIYFDFSNPDVLPYKELKSELSDIYSGDEDDDK